MKRLIFMLSVFAALMFTVTSCNDPVAGSNDNKPRAGILIPFLGDDEPMIDKSRCDEFVIDKSSVCVDPDEYKNKYVFIVLVPDERFELDPDPQNPEWTKDEALNRLFKDFGVIRYCRSAPGSKYNYFVIYLTGDADLFDNSLREMDVFEEVIKREYYIPEITSIKENKREIR